MKKYDYGEGIRSYDLHESRESKRRRLLDDIVHLRKKLTNIYSWCLNHKKSQIDKYKNKPGIEIGTFIDEMTAKHQIILYTDDNKPFQFYCYWCGYFERLYSAEIKNVESDLKFEV